MEALGERQERIIEKLQNLQEKVLHLAKNLGVTLIQESYSSTVKLDGNL